MKQLTVNQWVRAIAGAFVLLSLAFGVDSSPLYLNGNFLWFTAFVGANLLQSAFTGLCPLESFLRRLGIPDEEGGRASS
ncbi:MAG: DUF2892 domain-containing protein [Hydrogenophilus sp.]|nr:DUF2892 domain-containing protein [Hydrogenophilus sp.]